MVRQGADLDPADLVARLVHAGYRREYQVEARGELAVRGGIVDVFGSTANLPIRIDLFGDEVERLTEFEVAGQRSVADLEQVELFGCREVVLTNDVRERARLLSQDAPFARDNFARIADGELFDGMESWLPWLSADEHLFTDLLDGRSRVVLVEPRRLRDRAAELLDEEVALSESLATTWGLQAIDVTAGDAEAPPRLRPPLAAHLRQGRVAAPCRRELEHGHASSLGLATGAGRFRRSRPPPG